MTPSNNQTQAAVAEEIEAICDKLLANVNMETYRYEMVQMEEAAL